MSGRLRKGLRRPLAAAAVFATAAGALLVAFAAWQLHSPAAAAEPSTRRSVAEIAERISDAPAAAPLSLDIPVIDFHAPVLPMPADRSGVLTPPSDGDAYWLPDYGLPGTGSTNTVYLIGHTSPDGRAVFDPLVDPAAGESVLLPGDEIVVRTEAGAVVYTVVVTERHDKQALADLENVWTAAPGRLVLITCLFAADGETAPDNLVVFARQRTEV